MLGPAVHYGKDTTHKSLKTIGNAHVYVADTMLQKLCKQIQDCSAMLW